MVLAETVQIDGEVVALFLVVVGLLLAAYIAFIVVGARVVHRARRQGASERARIWAALVAAIDAALVATWASNGAGQASLLLVVPAAVHAMAWFSGGDRG